MFLFVGLGNIGSKYENTRHNVGFMFVDNFLKKYDFNYEGTKFLSEIWSGKIENEKYILIKPQTFMNESGLAVSKVAKFYKIENSNIYVFHDDIDLEFCKIKFKIGGSSAGHNGIKSIDSFIGNDYNRLRIGIGRPEYSNNVINFVLKKFNLDEQKCLNEKLNKIVDEINLLLKNQSLFLTRILIK